MRHSCSSSRMVDRTVDYVNATEECRNSRYYWRQAHSPCLSSLTEKNEKRAIFALPFPRPKFFHYSWKPCIHRAQRRSTDSQHWGEGGGWSRRVLIWADGPIMEATLWRNGRPMSDSASTWEKLQLRIMKYIARINVARHAIRTRRSDISALLVDIYFAERHFHDSYLSLSSTLSLSLFRARSFAASLVSEFIASCVGRACWRRFILSLFTQLTRSVPEIISAIRVPDTFKKDFPVNPGSRGDGGAFLVTFRKRLYPWRINLFALS